MELFPESDYSLDEEARKFDYYDRSEKESESESEYDPSSSESESDASSVEENFSGKIVKVPHTSKKASDSRFYAEGCNTKKIGHLKPSTEYSYVNSFHNFWKWLDQNYHSVVDAIPPHKTPKTFKEVKENKSPPLKFKKIKSNMFFEYVGTNDTSLYTTNTHMLRQGMKRIFTLFDNEDTFYKLMMDIRSKEILHDRTRVFKRSRMRKPDSEAKPEPKPPSPPPAKRSVILIDDDNEKPLQIDPLTHKLLYLKSLAYNQWEHLESLTPGLILQNQ